MVVFGSGASGRWLGLGEGMRVSPHEGVSVPTRRDTRDFGLSLPDMRTQQEGQCLQARKGALIMSQMARNFSWTYWPLEQ